MRQQQERRIVLKAHGRGGCQERWNWIIASPGDQADGVRFDATNSKRQLRKAFEEKCDMVSAVSSSRKIHIANKIALKVHFYIVINLIVVRISIHLDKLLCSIINEHNCIITWSSSAHQKLLIENRYKELKIQLASSTIPGKMQNKAFCLNGVNNMKMYVKKSAVSLGFYAKASLFFVVFERFLCYLSTT